MVKIIVWFVIGVCVMVYMVSPNEKEQAERSALYQTELAAKKTQQVEDMQARVHIQLQAILDNDRQGVINEIKAWMKKGDYGRAYGSANRFKRFDDRELTRLASIALTKNRKQQETKILAKLRKIPASKFQENITEYAKLVKLYPKKQRYLKKLGSYRKQLATRLKRNKQADTVRLARFGEPPKQSSWDNSYFTVKQYLKQIANDPDSIEMTTCTQVFNFKNGWLVGCVYRGSNAFGATVLNSNWFTIRHDRVVKMHESSAFKWG